MQSMRSSRSVVLVTVLVMMLLFAQGLGYLHGIMHAGWQPGAVHSLIDESIFDYGDSDSHQGKAITQADGGGDADHAAAHDEHHHSCAAYDAATLGASVHFSFPPLPLLPPPRVLALWQAFASWDAPFICHFSSRAPPR